ncbi:hypothetical protein FQZ97_1006360 [compost metagenome]
MAFATDHTPLGLPGLGLKFRPLAFDPAELTHHGQAHGFVVQGQRSRHTHPPLRWVYAKVQVLDRLAHDLHGQATDHDFTRLSIHADA